MSDYDDDFDSIPDDTDFDPDAPVEGIDPADYGGEGDELTPEQVAAYLAEREAKRFDPRPFEPKPSNKRICVVDTETDPFEFGVIPRPFCLGFDMGDRYLEFWGDDCVNQFFKFLATVSEPLLIYAHNGGKFDFHFFLKHMDEGQTPLIMNGRIVKIKFQGQEFRDSFAIIPTALSAYKKDEIDYSNFTRDKREKHKAEILKYMRADCTYSRELIIGFHEVYGDHLTIASASLKMLNGFHGFERFTSDAMDERFRRYYYGGRNQCFAKGILSPRPGKQWRMYDRRSMYPSEMANTLHPISNRCILQTEITDDTDFACIDAWNDGALPIRKDDGGLDFTTKYGTFYATIHEIKAGLETGTLRINRVRHAWAFDKKATLATFVHKINGYRQDAISAGDDVRKMLYKFGLNSPYGKFALNPRKFRQWTMTKDEIPEPLASPDNPEGWRSEGYCGEIMIWSRPSPRKHGFYNVATAASITGSARANLWRNICKATRPVYCDTDSIICEDFNGDIGPDLGQWNLEAVGNTVAIAGKKLYTIFDSTAPEWLADGRPIKKASKGVSLTARQIVQVCKGFSVEYKNPVPTFNIGKPLDELTERDFVRRIITTTGN
jgi:hypothetical protein